jgi:hypothetical protein
VDYKERANDVVKAVMEMPASLARSLAAEAKKEITDEYISLYNDMFRAINYIDYAVSVNAPDPSWQFGWYVYPTAQGTAGASLPPARNPKEERRRKVIAIAQRLVDAGATKVKTADIAAELKRDGDPTAEKSLTVAAGNILNAMRWVRAWSGEYEPPRPKGFEAREEEMLDATRQ